MMPSRDSRSSSNSDRNSMASNEGVHHQSPTYVLEHLATFSVSPDNDLVYPADGMRRLLAMEKTNGIWTQKMLMRIERKMVNIMDHENKEIVEQFPLGLVQEPTAFTSNDPKEMYNNILIYIVGQPPTQSPIPAEMHIFQCVNVRAREVVEDIKSIMSGRGSAGGYRSPTDVVEVGDLSPYDGAGEPVRMHAQLSAQLESSTRSRQSNNADETSSTSSDKYERDVTILNRCFDDIEKFIARLQHAAAAFRELEKRRHSRKSKRKDMGDGMLSMRAKPPPEREFVDIFQKFKLSFNLLAKLKAHIHDPNSPELVHFLFTPLALIVDASHDSHYGPNLPSKVTSPLLTGNAVELLINCLTSKESELWHSLGEVWYVPSEEWKGYVSPYKPVFMDGWSPSSYVDLSEAPPNNGKTGGGRAKHYGNEDYDEGDGGTLLPTDSEKEELHGHGHGHGHHHRGHTPLDDYPRQSPLRRRNSDLSADSVDRNGGAAGGGKHVENNLTRFESQQRAWLVDLSQQGSKVVQVTYPRTANNEKELSVVRGEFLEVLDDTRKWWKTRNIQGQVGHVPHTIVTEAFDDGPPQGSSAGGGGGGGGGGRASAASGEYRMSQKEMRKAGERKGAGDYRYF